ncbi:ferritin family protein, partial [Aliarcobacter butzleri]
MDFISSYKVNLKKALKQQQNEINDNTIYKALSLLQKNEENKKIFEKIANEEKRHYDFWVKITNKQLKA